MAPTKYSYTNVFDCQVDACKEFFQELIFLKPYSATPNGRPIYDITGFDGQQVVSVLSAIVNDRDQFTMNKTFYLLIRNTVEETTQAGFEEFFKIQARPTEHQPGNAIVFLRPRGKKKFSRQANSYEELNGALRAFYDSHDIYGNLIRSDTSLFSMHIQQLFKDNSHTDNIPQPTFEAYMYLLFEIARRSVKLENPSAKKEAFDVLPIGSAIARLLKLLQLSRCTFEDVFFSGGRFHCFTGTPEQRRKAIENINQAFLAITQQETLTKDHHLKELQEMYCSRKRQAMGMGFKYLTGVLSSALAGQIILILIILIILILLPIFSNVNSKPYSVNEHFRTSYL